MLSPFGFGGLAEVMKRLIYILSFAALFGFISYFLIGEIAHWYEHNAAQSEHDLSTAFLWSLSSLILSVVIGAVVGNIVYSKHNKGKQGIVKR